MANSGAAGANRLVEVEAPTMGSIVDSFFSVARGLSSGRTSFGSSRENRVFCSAIDGAALVICGSIVLRYQAEQSVEMDEGASFG